MQRKWVKNKLLNGYIPLHGPTPHWTQLSFTSQASGKTPVTPSLADALFHCFGSRGPAPQALVAGTACYQLPTRKLGRGPRGTRWPLNEFQLSSAMNTTGTLASLASDSVPRRLRSEGRTTAPVSKHEKYHDLSMWENQQVSPWMPRCPCRAKRTREAATLPNGQFAHQRGQALDTTIQKERQHIRAQESSNVGPLQSIRGGVWNQSCTQGFLLPAFMSGIFLAMEWRKWEPRSKEANKRRSRDEKTRWIRKGEKQRSKESENQEQRSKEAAPATTCFHNRCTSCWSWRMFALSSCNRSRRYDGNQTSTPPNEHFWFDQQTGKQQSVEGNRSSQEFDSAPASFTQRVRVDKLEASGHSTAITNAYIDFMRLQSAGHLWFYLLQRRTNLRFRINKHIFCNEAPTTPNIFRRKERDLGWFEPIQRCNSQPT